jgi:hypothetical protein
MTARVRRWWFVVLTIALSLSAASPVTADFDFRAADPAVPSAFFGPAELITVNNPTTTQLLDNGFSATLDFTVSIPPGTGGDFFFGVAIDRDFTVAGAQQDRTRSAMSGTVTIVGTDTTVSQVSSWFTGVVVDGFLVADPAVTTTDQPAAVGPGTFPIVGEGLSPRFSAPVGPATLQGAFSSVVTVDASDAIQTFRYQVEGSSTIEPLSGPSTPYSFTNIADSSGQFSGFNPIPSMNNSGTVAFIASLDTGESGIFSGSGGPTTTLYDTSGPFSGFGGFDSFFNITGPSLNDSGTVAFIASLDAGEQGIFTGSGGPPTTIVDTSGPFARFDAPSLVNSRPYGAISIAA